MGRDRYCSAILIIICIFVCKTQTAVAEVPLTNGAMPNTRIVEETFEPLPSQTMAITGYCACQQCVGIWYTDNPVKYGASGRQLISGYSVATNSLPLGTVILIDGKEYRVDDRGTTGIDIYYDTHEGACSQGYSVKEVFICG